MGQISAWAKANGGAPAVILAGVAVLAVSAPLAIALFVIGAGWFVLGLKPVRRFVIHRLGGAAKDDQPAISLDRALANALRELKAIQFRLNLAAETGNLAELPSEHYQALADLMTDRGWIDSRRTLEEAYGGCDDLQHRHADPSRGWEEGPMGADPAEVMIEDSDDLPGLQRKVVAAIAELERLQG